MSIAPPKAGQTRTKAARAKVDDGWVEQFFGNVMSNESHTAAMSGTIFIGTVLVSVIFLRGGLTMTGKGHPFGEAMVYGMMAYGAYTLYLWLF